MLKTIVDTYLSIGSCIGIIVLTISTPKHLHNYSDKLYAKEVMKDVLWSLMLVVTWPFMIFRK